MWRYEGGNRDSVFSVSIVKLHDCERPAALPGYPDTMSSISKLLHKAQLCSSSTFPDAFEEQEREVNPKAKPILKPPTNKGLSVVIYRMNVTVLHTQCVYQIILTRPMNRSEVNLIVKLFKDFFLE